MKQKEKIKVYRTREGNIFELVFLVLMIIVWVLMVRLLSSAPEVVPTHFDAAGNPNSYDSKYAILFPCIMTTVAGIITMMGAYFPHTINIPGGLKTPRQYELAIRMMRILGLTLLVLTLAIGWTSLGSVRPSAVPTLAVVGVMFAVIIVFTILIYRSR